VDPRAGVNDVKQKDILHSRKSHPGRATLNTGPVELCGHCGRKLAALECEAGPIQQR
jgi:hypothetical protein